MTDQSRTSLHLPGQPAQGGVLLDPTGAALPSANGKAAAAKKPGLLARTRTALAARRARLEQQADAEPADQPATPQQSRRHGSRVLVFVAPLVAVNTTAVIGQVGWAYDHLHIAHLPTVPGFAWASYAVHLVNLLVAILFAATLESIGLYLSAEAHAALLNRDPALKLRLASYGMGLVAGGLNYSHFAHGLNPTTEAVAFGLLSASSPLLWAIRSRSRSRAELVEQGLIDQRAAHFSTSKWINFPVRTWKAFRLAVDMGVTQEREAWTNYRLAREQKAADEALRKADAEFEKAAKSIMSVVIWSGSIDRSAAGRESVESTAKPTTDPTGEVTARADQKLTGQPTADPTDGADRQPTADSTNEPTSRPDRQPTARPDRKSTSKPTGRRRGSRPARGDYSTTLAALRKTFPSRLPTVAEVKIADGNRSQGRAVTIRKQLARERGISDDSEERAG